MFEFKKYQPKPMSDFKYGDKIFLPESAYKYMLGMMRLPSDSESIDIDGISFMPNKELTDKAVSI